MVAGVSTAANVLTDVKPNKQLTTCECGVATWLGSQNFMRVPAHSLLWGLQVPQLKVEIWPCFGRQDCEMCLGACDSASRQNSLGGWALGMMVANSPAHTGMQAYNNAALLVKN
jgi:hypothetical protein